MNVMQQPESTRSIVWDLFDVYRRLRELEAQAFEIERATLLRKIARLEQQERT
ncbi:hypothetical protein GF108_08920 [Phyllobacterium sp. SYP-B3895]|uniref:hypothetical protein n=1 Tax=Phyllobacterium sp. SYP-B3895 TaxID=2663240 RepID=UPI001299E559|nr:hypothetical protein [Phyllobacterium sp. SYP-B3895]MRG55703.1 hypothetical protein [Phyllobacterium sp. SYP-B3895]